MRFHLDDGDELIADVFKTLGQPTLTYVRRDKGKLEATLRSALNERGQLCLITGPSKTGKTTLYREVLASRSEIPLIVRCDRKKTCLDVWREALEAVQFERVESRTSTQLKSGTVEAEGAAKFSWKWLAEISGKIRATFVRASSEAEIKAKILSDPGPDLLIPILRQTRYVLVIEDFHYLIDNEKTLLFQQWKRFIDSEVSVLVLGTSHRAVDIANSNRDLLGRIAQIDVAQWSQDDLEQIITQGFKHLKVRIMPECKDLIAREAVGLPIVVQQVCLQLFTEREIERTSDKRRLKFEPNSSDVTKSLHAVARLKYTQFESYYSSLIRGPREKTRKYRTYELILLCFTLDPIKFALQKTEIDQRLTKMDLAAREIPPLASLKSTLAALKKFQEKRDFSLLEWQSKEDKLYIIEPSFLFYVRWRKPKDVAGSQYDLFERLLNTTWGLAYEANLKQA